MDSSSQLAVAAQAVGSGTDNTVFNPVSLVPTRALELASQLYLAIWTWDYVPNGGLVTKPVALVGTFRPTPWSLEPGAWNLEPSWNETCVVFELIPSGIRGLYTGLTASIFRQMTYSLTRLGAYDAIKAQLSRNGEFESTLTSVAIPPRRGGGCYWRGKRDYIGIKCDRIPVQAVATFNNNRHRHRCRRIGSPMHDV
jgi:hypothetical protein